MPDHRCQILSREQARCFHEKGYLHIKGVIDQWELERLDAVTRTFIDTCQRYKPMDNDYNYCIDPVTGNEVFARINSALLRNDAFVDLFGHPKILGIAHDVLGPDFVAGLDAMVVKLPEYGMPVPWHRDPGHPRIHPPFDVDVYLDPATPDNGCLYVIPESHRWQGFSLQDMLDEHGFNLPGAIPIIAEPGDVVLHSCNTLHGSRSTRGKPMRRIIYYAYNAIEELLCRGGPWNEQHILNLIRVMLDAVNHRARLPETSSETPFTYQPTKPQFRLDPQNLGHIERRVTWFRDQFDTPGFPPGYRYSPRTAVTPKP